MFENNTLRTAWIFARSVILQIFFIIVVVLATGTVLILSTVLSMRARHKIIAMPGPCITVLQRMICGIKLEITGLENIPQGNFVALCKHQTNWETIYLQYLLQPACSILKVQLLYIPIFGWGLACVQPIPINRNNPRAAIKRVMEEGLKRLSQGNNIVIYPEGTRVAYGEKGKYARSGAALALAGKVPILPIAHNAGICWPGKNKFIKHPGTIRLVIGEPIPTNDCNSKQLTSQVEAWIESQQQQFYSA